MKLREEQMTALGDAKRADFAKRMVAHLRERFTKQLLDQGVKPAGLEPFVDEGIEQAAGYEVKYNDDVRLYLECMALFGRKFDRDQKRAWAGEILNRKDISGHAKMEMIHGHLLFNPEAMP